MDELLNKSVETEIAAAERATDGATAGEQPVGAWATLRAAFVGSVHQDFTRGSIGRAIFLLAVPMVLETLMESLFGVVNAFWVSRLGQDSLATVGLTESMLTIIFAVCIGLGMGTTAMIARRIGEGRREAAGDAAAQAIILGVATSLVIGAFGFTFAPALLRLMGASPSVVAVGAGYPRIIYGANICIVLLFLNNAVFRGSGDASIAMRALWLGNAINLVLDPCFIFGLAFFPRLGVTGSAIATTIGRGTAVVFQIWVLTTGRSRVRVHLAQLRPQLDLTLRLVRVSLGGMFQFLIATASWVVIVRLVSAFGSAAVAGYTVALRIIVVAILPSWGMSNAAATLVGQNLGAGQPERAEKSVWKTGFVNMLFLAGVTLLFLLFAERLVGVFTSDPAIVPYAVDCLRFISYGYVFYAWGMVVAGSFNGAGDTYTPTLINLVCFWLFQIPLAYLLARHTALGARGIFLAIMISESVLAVVCILVFRRGHWKTKRV
ncbi:MAG: MATE family efflux transporter [Acidobacteria bacterium]|nr:MATE family efflux transporter [Acidobacteriota bacterium]